MWLDLMRGAGLNKQAEMLETMSLKPDLRSWPSRDAEERYFNICDIALVEEFQDSLTGYKPEVVAALGEEFKHFVENATKLGTDPVDELASLYARTLDSELELMLSVQKEAINKLCKMYRLDMFVTSIQFKRERDIKDGIKSELSTIYKIVASGREIGDDYLNSIAPSKEQIESTHAFEEEHTRFDDWYKPEFERVKLAGKFNGLLPLVDALSACDMKWEYWALHMISVDINISNSKGEILKLSGELGELGNGRRDMIQQVGVFSYAHCGYVQALRVISDTTFQIFNDTKYRNDDIESYTDAFNTIAKTFKSYWSWNAETCTRFNRVAASVYIGYMNGFGYDTRRLPKNRMLMHEEPKSDISLVKALKDAAIMLQSDINNGVSGNNSATGAVSKIIEALNNLATTDLVGMLDCNITKLRESLRSKYDLRSKLNIRTVDNINESIGKSLQLALVKVRKSLSSDAEISDIIAALDELVRIPENKLFVTLTVYSDNIEIKVKGQTKIVNTMEAFVTDLEGNEKWQEAVCRLLDFERTLIYLILNIYNCGDNPDEISELIMDNVEHDFEIKCDDGTFELTKKNGELLKTAGVSREIICKQLARAISKDIKEAKLTRMAIELT